MKIICISGKARHGKDTTARMMKEELEKNGSRVVIMHYGDLVKFICQTYFGWDGNKSEKGRSILQYIGTDVVRKKEPTFWCDFIVSMLTLFEDEWDYVIIADCRFPNEIEILRQAGFDVVHARVVRPNFDNGLSEEQNRHISETALDDFPVEIHIDNSGTLAGLKILVKNIVKKTFVKKQRQYIKSRDLCDRCTKSDCPDIVKNTPCEFDERDA